jgi:hypothetical protein
MMGGSQGWSEGLEEEKKYALAGFEIGAFQPCLCNFIKSKVTFIWRETYRLKI